ncbi:hypothetical protein RvY_13769 [Ramazzottius varieornatus]|uniref:G-protein coupled receptors family 1 profile domain-containing protein n=1 Tax=Ramazzottius varieornatus TaxID=947166 RepID=A0A1D1VP22_RAMVA|nr:hypothetical protein RvY_13769 [Ramazzottius varieornatus]
MLMGEGSSEFLMEVTQSCFPLVNCTSHEFHGLTKAGNFGESQLGTTPPTLNAILIAIPTFFIVIGTIAGNLLVCVAIIHSRQLRLNITNSFCASLAVSDLLLGLFVLPFSFGKLLTNSWILGSTVCNLYICLDVFLSTASILNLFVVSIDRYYAITRPLLYRSIITKRTAILMLTAVWILSALIAFVPIYSGWNTSDGRVQNVDEASSHNCVFLVETLPYSITIGIGTFYIPLIVLYIMYMKILTISYGHVKQIRAQTYISKECIPKDDGHHHRHRTHSHTHILRQHRATITLFIIVGAFTACWLPYFTCFTVNPLDAIQIHPVVEEVFLWMGYSNSCINPFVYGMTNREYRAAFRRLLCNWRKRESKYSISQSHTDHHGESDNICM